MSKTKEKEKQIETKENVYHCSVCGGDEFENLDHLRDHKYWFDRDLRYNEPVGFKICKGCGFTTYDYVDDLDEVYERNRPFVGVGNLITCNRKRLYHSIFLSDIDLPIDWKYVDVGCAQGYFLKYLHEEKAIPKENLYGTEWSTHARNFAKYEYGFENLSKDLPEDEKFDFISYYHVLEHIPYPEKELKKAIKALNPDGYLYITVPVWFDILEEASGPTCNDFENLWHINHINCFSENSFFQLLASAGLKIIKSNSDVYGYSVLCQVGETNIVAADEDWEQNVEIIEAQKKAIEHLRNGQYLQAIEAYPKYPDAYLMEAARYEKVKDFKSRIEWIDKGLDACPGHLKLKLERARVLAQWDENTPDKKHYSNNIRQAEEIFNEILEKKPSDAVYFHLAIINVRYKDNPELAIEYLKKVAEIDPSRWGECWNMIGQIRSKQS